MILPVTFGKFSFALRPEPGGLIRSDRGLDRNRGRTRVRGLNRPYRIHMFAPSTPYSLHIIFIRRSLLHIHSPYVSAPYPVSPTTFRTDQRIRTANVAWEARLMASDVQEVASLHNSKQVMRQTDLLWVWVQKGQAAVRTQNLQHSCSWGVERPMPHCRV